MCSVRFRDQSAGLKVLNLRVENSSFRDNELGFRVLDIGYRVWG